MRHDLIADALSTIRNAEMVGKEKCLVKPTSKILKEVLKIMKDKEYIDNFKYLENNRGGEFEVTLTGRINNCKCIKPRHALKKDEYNKWERRYLPAVGFGILIVSTPKGIFAHNDVKGKVGGVLLAYVY